MRLTNRDYNILDYIESNKGITLNQASKIFFDDSYKMASKRMNILVNGGYVQGAYHPNINKKVYYKDKIPSYHTILANSIVLLHKGNIHFSQREFNVGKCVVDFIVICKDKSVWIYEVDIFHRTSNSKIGYVFKEYSDLNLNFIIIGRNQKRYKNLDNRVKYLNINCISV